MLRAIGKLFKWIFTLIFIVTLISVLCVGYAHFIEPGRLTVKQLQDVSYSMEQPVTVAVFADTHFGFQYDMEDFQKVVDKVNENPPDILLFAGDLIDNLNQYPGDTSQISAKLAMMKANIGKYAVFGNHDYGGGAEHEYEDIMNAGGFKVLVNQQVTFRKYNLRLIGIDDMLIGYGNPAAADRADPAMYNLILCHEPDVADRILESSADYMFAGHSHGGQIRVPFYTQQFLPSYGKKYVKGQYALNNGNKTILYVNSGLGTTKVPARFRAVPELTYLTITPSQS